MCNVPVEPIQSSTHRHDHDTSAEFHALMHDWHREFRVVVLHDELQATIDNTDILTFSNSPPNELYLHRPHYNSDIALQISEDNFFLHQSPTHASSCCIVVVYACNSCNIDFFVLVSFRLPAGGCVSKGFETYVSQVHVKDGNILRSSSHTRTVQVRLLPACSVCIEHT